MKGADRSKGPRQDDDLPDVIEVVRAMGLDGVGEDTEAPPLPCRWSHLIRMAARRCRRIWRSSPVEPGIMSKRQAPPTRRAPMPPTGSIFD